MDWLLPRLPTIAGRVRTIGHPPKGELEAAKMQRLNAKGGRTAYFRQYRRDNLLRLRAYQAAKRREYRRAA